MNTFLSTRMFLEVDLSAPLFQHYLCVPDADAFFFLGGGHKNNTKTNARLQAPFFQASWGGLLWSKTWLREQAVNQSAATDLVRDSLL